MRLLPLIFILFLGACSSSGQKSGAQETDELDVLYSKATTALEAEKYQEATRYFEEVERQYPYADKATKSQMMGAYASYMGQDYDAAIIALDRFIQLHPGNEEVDYAYYLKALSYYDQISDVRRDQDMTLRALQALDALMQRFPDSSYARDASLKRDLTRDHLAGKEMEIGRYYLNEGHISAAMNRFRTVVSEYQTTTHVAEALHRLVEGYITLGLKGEALRIASVLGHNYPGSIWYKRSYDLLDDAARQNLIKDQGFIDRTVDSLFKPE